LHTYLLGSFDTVMMFFCFAFLVLCFAKIVCPKITPLFFAVKTWRESSSRSFVCQLVGTPLKICQYFRWIPLATLPSLKIPTHDESLERSPTAAGFKDY